MVRAEVSYVDYCTFVHACFGFVIVSRVPIASSDEAFSVTERVSFLRTIANKSF